ncbi:MFS transporter [Haloferax sp. Atlit-6N]|uniref:Major facilitator superfamily transporter n=1 Tax=Haloferax gibbonsii (strain ATCC 33959 / DSM 4427 / JCM 8863 / NBRC 102184 / NCIMB 2188 / Ma 2.38) TaxID=1227459 RepID=M0H0G6_HALGM|nr:MULTISPECIES: MFS transporter [Haloferax]ELZ77262.1 major facilitator superfamily transporter [Haloferax gibbonsii ATCC 33959]REA05168.1 MFS transporter [Haloferax sp. Atlit-6N]
MDSTRRERATLALAVWGVLVSQVLLYPGVSDLVTALGGGQGEYDLSAGMLFLVAEFASFVAFSSVWGALSDALGRRTWLIVAGALGGAASYVALLALATLPWLDATFGAVLAVRLVGGAMTIGAFSLSITMLADLSGGNGRNMGAAGIAIGLGAALGSVVGGQLTTIDPLAPLYASAAALTAVALLVTTVTDRTPDSTRVGVGVVLKKLAARPAFAVPYAFGFIDRMTAGFFALVGVYYFRETFGANAAVAGGVLALFFVPFALLQYPLGSLSDRVGRFVPVVAGSMLYGVAIIAVGLAPVFELAAGLMVVVGVFGALVAPATMALVTDLAEPGERGAALGGFNVFGSLGFLAGFLVGGVVADAVGYLPSFLVVGFAEVAIAVVALRAVKRLDGIGAAQTPSSAD